MANQYKITTCTMRTMSVSHAPWHETIVMWQPQDTEGWWSLSQGCSLFGLHTLLPVFLLCPFLFPRADSVYFHTTSSLFHFFCLSFISLLKTFSWHFAPASHAVHKQLCHLRLFIMRFPFSRSFLEVLIFFSRFAQQFSRTLVKSQISKSLYGFLKPILDSPVSY